MKIAELYKVSTGYHPFCPQCGENIKVKHNDITQCSCGLYLINQGNALYYTDDEKELPPNGARDLVPAFTGDGKSCEYSEYQKTVLNPLFDSSFE